MPKPSTTPRILTLLALGALATRCSPAPGMPDVRSVDGGDADASLDARDAPDVSPPDGDAGPAPSCVRARTSAEAPSNQFSDGAERATVTVEDPASCARRYSLATTLRLRDNQPGNPRRVTETAHQPVARTGSDMFDALYALAVEEARENAVASIRDHAFNNGQPLECPPGGCFETGRLWNYVWTRDTAYSVDLALGAVDPTRARNSLEFKLSERRAGGGLQVVQDTGTGGSYPVSTDRVTWALGAWELLKFLDGAERTAFRDRAYEALRNTVEHDRAVVYDAADGLYTGEQSFLDWREQTYPRWAAEDLVHIAMSKALSTNVAHYVALTVTARLAAERGDEAARARYQGFADALRDAIRRRFYLPDAGLYSTFATTYLDPAPTHQYDLLGTALVVLSGVAEPAQARELVARYPHAGKGPPTIWPQQQHTPIYHNRSFWPFVTAYWARAARRVRNDEAVNRALWSLMRGAALNLSNMENFELVTGGNWVEDGPNSGPVVNSQRQLWSVAGYLSMVHDVVFGLEATQEGVRFAPYVTRRLRNTVFANADSIALSNFPYRGRRLTVVVNLPPRSDAMTGAYAVGAVRLDGRDVGDAVIPAAMLPPSAVLEVTLTEGSDPPATVTSVDDVMEWRNVFGPRTPRVAGLAEDGGRLRLALETGGEAPADVAFNVYRDGALVGRALPGGTTSWVDPGSNDYRAVSHCYTVETYFLRSNNHSQHAAPACWWGRHGERIQTVTAYDFRNMGGTGVNNHGQFHFENWGDAGHTLEVPEFRPNYTGNHLLQLLAGNGAGGVTTGITCGVKLLTVEELPAGTVVGHGQVVMPHQGSWSTWRGSSFVRARLEAGRAYRIRVHEDERSVNMSTFRHFASYTGGTGGTGGAFNRVNVAAVSVLALDGVPAATGGRVALDGANDFGDFRADNRVAPGIPLASWDGFALDWDADYFYIAVSSQAFEASGDRPFMLYLQAGTGAFAAPAARAGATYFGQTANVPFAANYLVALRRQSDVGDGAGPWNGLFRHEGGAWVRQTRFEPGRDFWVGSDMNRTLAVRIPRAQLGHPARVRLAGHVVSGGGNYNDVVPAAAAGAEHQPWQSGRTQGFYEIDLAADSAARNWTAR